MVARYPTLVVSKFQQEQYTRQTSQFYDCREVSIVPRLDCIVDLIEIFLHIRVAWKSFVDLRWADQVIEIFAAVDDSFETVVDAIINLAEEETLSYLFECNFDCCSKAPIS